MEIHCKYDELVKPSELIQNARNPNKHPKDQIDALKHSLQTYGWQRPIEINKQKLIVDGHGRVRAALELNAQQIPIVYKEMDADKEYGYSVAVNATAQRSRLSYKIINEDFVHHGPDLSIDDLCIKDFDINACDKPRKRRINTCPRCSHKWTKDGPVEGEELNG